MTAVPETPPAAPTTEPPEPPHAAFNFRALVGDVSAFFIGISFLDAATALPALVGRLGGDPAFLGALLAARQGAYYLPQLVVAHRLQHATRYKPLLVRVCLLGRIWFFPAALVVGLFGASHPGLALAALSAAYLTSWTADGAGGVPWTALVGRLVPARRRGRLFATTQVVSGVSRFAVSAAVGALLSGRFIPFPVSGGLLVLFCGVFLAVSWAFLAVLREPPPEMPPLGDGKPVPDTAPGGFGAYLAGLPARLKARPDLAALALVQVLSTASSACSPFYVGYAGRLLATGEGTLAGLFLAAQTAGLLCCAPLWGMLTDRRGPRKAMLALLTLATLSPLVALAAGRLGGGSLPLFLLAYFCFGAVVDGWVVVTNYLLEVVPAGEQPTYIGLMNAASAPALLLPVGAGLLVRAAGEAPAFVAAALLLAAGWCVAYRLPETRKGGG